MPPTADKFDQANPFFVWSSTRDAYVQNWNQAMLELVDSKAYAKSIESILDSYLKNSESFRSAIKAAVSEAVMQVEAPPRPKAAAKVIPKQAAGTGQRPAAKATARKGPSKRPSQATANE